MLATEDKSGLHRFGSPPSLKIKTAMSVSKPVSKPVSKSVTEPALKLNKHEMKTRETRELLLQAAMKVFVRDGYEGAELGEIAALAGRTKGAIYAQFKSKEDIFLALWEEHVLRYRAQMLSAIAASGSTQQNLEAVREFYLRLSHDRDWNLLMLEFKLFTIRHPESRKRLLEFHSRLVPAGQEERMSTFLGPPGKNIEGMGWWVAIRSIHALLSGLTLESQFEPGLFEEETIQKIVGLFFDSLL